MWNIISGVVILTTGVLSPVFCQEPEIQHDVSLEMTLIEDQGVPRLTVKMTNTGKDPILLPVKFLLCYGQIDCLDANGESLFVPIPQRFPVIVEKQRFSGGVFPRIASLRFSRGRWRKNVIEWQTGNYRESEHLAVKDKKSIMLEVGQSLTQQISLAKPIREIGLGHGTSGPDMIHTPLYFESFKSINLKEDWIRVQIIRLEFGDIYKGDTVFGMLFSIDTEQTNQDDWQYLYSGKNKTVEMTLNDEMILDTN